MNKSTDHIRLNVNSVKLSKRICVRQEDTVFRTIAATFVNEGVPILLTDAVLAEILITHPNNTVTYQGCVISGDEVLYTLRSSDIAVTGEHTTQFRITYEDGEVFTSPEFVIEVYSKSFSDTEIVSQNDYSGITAAVANAASYATTAQNILTEINTQKAAFDDEFAEAQETVVEINKTEEEFKGLSLAVIADAKKAQDAAGNAENYKSAAATSATNAATSATNAATSAASAAASINEMTTLVNTSKTQINTLTSSSITAIENKAEEAIASIETDLSGAAQAAASALASANSASNSATAAETSKNNASTYATAAQGSKEDAQAAADLAAGYKNQAANQVTLAEAQVALATTQASNAASSAASAASAATTAATTAVTAATAKQTATSTDFNLSTADGGIEVERVVGKSFKSANLFSNMIGYKTRTSNGVTVISSGNHVNISGTPTSASWHSWYENILANEFLLKAGTYTFHVEGTINNSTFNIGIRNVTDSGSLVFNSISEVSGGRFKTFTITEDKKVGLFIHVASTSIITDASFDVMLNEGSTALPYNPYGIHSSGQYGCVDLGDLEWTKYTDNNKYCFYTTIANKKLITEKGISSDIYCEEYTVMPSSNLAGYSDNDRVIWSGASTSLGYIDVRDGRYTDVASFKSAMKGTYLAYEYSSTPSQYAEVWEETNLFCGNVSIVQGSIDANGNESSATTRLRTDFIKVSPSTIYTVTAKGNSLKLMLKYYKADKSYIDGTAWANGSNTFTTQSNAEYLRVIIAFENNSTITPSNISNFGIAEGTVAIYGEAKTIIFPLAETLRSVGDVHDYIDVESGVIVRKVGALELSSATWTRNGTNYGYTTPDLQNLIKKPENNNIIANAICEKYSVVTAGSMWAIDGNYIGVPSTGNVWVTLGTIATEGTPSGLFVYELATATTQPLTAEQLNALNSFKSFSGKTIITSQDLADAKPSVTLNYGKSDAMAKALEGVCEAKRVDANEPNNEAITDAWTSSKTYSVGSYVIHEDKLYKCLVQNIGVMPPNATYWELTSIANELQPTKTTGTVNVSITGANYKNNVCKVGHFVYVTAMFTLSADVAGYTKILTLPYPPIQETQVYATVDNTNIKTMYLGINGNNGFISNKSALTSGQIVAFSVVYYTDK